MNKSLNTSWFYAEGNTNKGPFSFRILQQLLKDELPESTLVWTEGMNEWAPASNVPGLYSSGNSHPYAPPVLYVDDIPASDGVSLEIPSQSIPLDVGYCIKQAWRHTCANFGDLFLLGLVYFFAYVISAGVLSSIAVAIDGDLRTSSSIGLATLFTDLLLKVFSVFLSLGATRYGHQLLNGEKPEITVLFSQGNKLVSAIGANILYFLMVILGLLFLIIPGIILAIRFSFFQQAIVEKRLGPIESLKYSWNLTRGNGLSLFGLGILSFFVLLAGGLALLFGLLWAIPTWWLSILIAFRFLHCGENTLEASPREQ